MNHTHARILICIYVRVQYLPGPFRIIVFVHSSRVSCRIGMSAVAHTATVYEHEGRTDNNLIYFCIIYNVCHRMGFECQSKGTHGPRKYTSIVNKKYLGPFTHIEYYTETRVHKRILNKMYNIIWRRDVLVFSVELDGGGLFRRLSPSAVLSLHSCMTLYYYVQTISKTLFCVCKLYLIWMRTNKLNKKLVE